MFNVNDTIIAVSSGTTDCLKKIIRISGDNTFSFLQSFFGKEFPKQKQLSVAKLKIEGFETQCFVYTFVSPNSYTGEDLAELHIIGCDELIEKIFLKFLEAGARAAIGGEYTYRAYVNGKIDLSHAEAIAEMIESSNQYQLEAAQKLFGGSIEKKAAQARKDILELLSLIEAGLDFSAEDIEIISRKKAQGSAEKILSDLKELLSGSITFEQISQAPTVVFTGSPNAGKSSLVNAVIGENRSIVSDQSGTTRDILEHWLKLEKCDCVLVDSAGVITETKDLLQILANNAAKKAVADATVLVFCVDVTKENYKEDLEIIKNAAWAKAHPTIFAATKCDLRNYEKIKTLENSFKQKFIETSSQNETGIEELKKAIELNLIRSSSETSGKAALTERHKSAISEAAKNLENAIVEIQDGHEEIAAYLLRAALQDLSRLETEHIDEAILDNIFSRFCIGK